MATTLRLFDINVLHKIYARPSCPTLSSIYATIIYVKDG